MGQFHWRAIRERLISLKLISLKMFFMFFLSALLVVLTSSGCGGGSGGGSGGGNISCPTGYVAVPPMADYTSKAFCVMKYEAKNDGSGNAVSQAAGMPWVNIDRYQAIAKCQAIGLGYDLITNDEWQTMARNAAHVPFNWGDGAVGSSKGLSRGNSNSSGALSASADDNQACSGLNVISTSCSGSAWHEERRILKLSNGKVFWDLSGNVWEWVKDDNRNNYGGNAYISQVTLQSHPASHSLSGGTTTIARVAKNQFGPSGNYSGLSRSPYGGLGYGSLGYSRGAVLRGGKWNSGTGAGVFAVALYDSATDTASNLGFRCVCHP